MSRKKKGAPVNHERWLISYADFITLLFALFVVLFATGQADKKKEANLSVAMQSAFNRMGMFDPHAKQPAVTAVPGSSASAQNQPWGTADGEQMAETIERLKAAATKEIGLGEIALHTSSDGLVVSLREAGFFESGEAKIRPETVPVLNRIAEALPDRALRVEGHTDDVPIQTAQFASNWELSSARASSVARLLLQHENVRPETISVAGYAEFHPMATNQTAEGRAQNRRVDIVILNLK